MDRLSRPFFDWIRSKESERTFDAIVVGSGYGGAVAALRLSERGLRVLVLERGSEYVPGEFPNDLNDLPKYWRLNLSQRGTPVGRGTGLWDFHVGEGVVSLVGNGL